MTKTEELVEALTDLMRAVLNAEQAPESSSDRRRLQAAELAMESALDAAMLRPTLDAVPVGGLLDEIGRRADSAGVQFESVVDGTYDDKDLKMAAISDEELLTELKARMDRGLNLRPWLDAVEKLEGKR